MTEKNLEKELVQATKRRGGVAFKFVSPGTTGVPDRLIVLPENKVGFVEVKSTGKKPRPEQVYQLNRLHTLGCHAYVIDHEDEVEQVINDIQAGGTGYGI